MPRKPASAITGELTLVEGPIPADTAPASRKAPAAGVAARLISHRLKKGGTGLLVAANERRADEIAAALAALRGVDGPEVLVMPAAYPTRKVLIGPPAGPAARVVSAARPRSNG